MLTARLTATIACVLTLAAAGPARAQQRPLVTEDPEPIGAGRLMLEGGIDFAHDQQYPVSGLRGDLVRVPTLGVSIGISAIAEIQIDGGIFNRLAIKGREPAPLSDQLTVTGDSTMDVQDMVIGTKVRILSERPGRTALAFRFATELPNASNESGLGEDTTDFYASLIAGKTVQSVRVVGNFGLAILMDPTEGARQNDLLTYGVSFARALTDRAELVGEFNGRLSTREGEAFPGTESRGILNFGGRYTSGAFRLDGGFYFGLYDVDPTFGFTGGFTYVFNAFDVP